MRKDQAIILGAIIGLVLLVLLVIISISTPKELFPSPLRVGETIGLVCSNNSCSSPNPFCFAKNIIFLFGAIIIILGVLGLAGTITLKHSTTGLTITFGAIIFGAFLLALSLFFIAPC